MPILHKIENINEEMKNFLKQIEVLEFKDTVMEIKYVLDQENEKSNHQLGANICKRHL